jgi:hypothetical protein
MQVRDAFLRPECRDRVERQFKLPTHHVVAAAEVTAG